MMRCPNCAEQCENDWKACPKCGTELSARYIPKREYRVVERKMKGMMGFSRITERDMENMLNAEAKDGWIFQNCVAGETLHDRDLIMLIFYRELI